MFHLKKIYQIIGNKIKEQRKKADNLSQENLSEAVGLKRITLINMEKGKQKIPLDILYLIADYFSLNITSFLPTDKEIKEILSDKKGIKFDSFSENDLSDEEKNFILKDILNK
jgi:DNA-binding XRE family transcriptional regulator